MVPVISRSQRRKIQWRYTQYQKDLKEGGEGSSLVQLKSQAEGEEDSKLDHSLKSTLPDKRSYSREQLAKVHSELKAKERSSLAGLEKGLMESDSEIEDEVVPGLRKGMVKKEMFEAFMAEQTFLVKKPTETDQSKKVTNTEVLECSMEDASEVIEQVD